MFTVSLAALAACALTALPQDDGGSQDASVAKPVLLGSGSHQYRWVEGWPTLPAEVTYGNTHGCMASDSKGNVYVNTDSERAVMVFSPEGKLIDSWGAELRGGVHGMCLVKEGDTEFLYLSHIGRHQVFKTTLKGEVLWTLDYPEASGLYENAGQYRPTGVAVASNGDIFIGDGYGKSYVHQYDKERKYIRSFGGHGTEPGKMRTPHGVLIDKRGETETLIVCDRENARLQHFSLDGELLSITKGMLRRPCNVYPLGDELVIADLAGRITVLNGKNELILQLGDNPDPNLRAKNGIPVEQWKAGEFLSPHGACFDAQGNIYVQDWNRLGRVTKLERLK